jgi:hypothetical protein
MDPAVDNMRAPSDRQQPLRKTLRRFYLALCVVLLGSLLSLHLVVFVLVGSAAGFAIAMLALFYGVKLRDLCQPIPKRYLLAPILAVSVLLTALLLSLWFVVLDIADRRASPMLTQAVRIAGGLLDRFLGMGEMTSLFHAVFCGSLLFFTISLFLLVGHFEKYRVFTRLTVVVCCASVGQLGAMLLLVLLSSKDFELLLFACMPGGVAGLIWSMGSYLTIQYLRPRYLEEKAMSVILCPTCDLDLRGSIVFGLTACPDCQTPIPAEST